MAPSKLSVIRHVLTCMQGLSQYSSSSHVCDSCSGSAEMRAASFSASSPGYGSGGFVTVLPFLNQAKIKRTPVNLLVYSCVGLMAVLQRRRAEYKSSDGLRSKAEVIPGRNTATAA